MVEPIPQPLSGPITKSVGPSNVRDNISGPIAKNDGPSNFRTNNNDKASALEVTDSRGKAPIRDTIKTERLISPI